MKNPILIFTLAVAVCLFCSFDGGKPKHKTKPKHRVVAAKSTGKAKSKHKVTAVKSTVKPKPKPIPKVVATAIPTNKSVCSFNIQFSGGDKKSPWVKYVTTDVQYRYNANGAFYMFADLKGGKKFEISYIASDRIPTPRYQLMRASNVKSKYYIRYTMADHSELYFSGYDINFINTKEGIRSDIPLLTAGHNTMQTLHLLLPRK